MKTEREQIHELRQQLAEAQALIVQYREVLSELEEAARCVQTGDWDRNSINPERMLAKRLLAQSSDTSVLESMITKAGEVMRTRCYRAMVGYTTPGLDLISSLPELKLEDLK